ncbi:hypothetical protein HOLleu_14742 [Holothuria leucospilota]|uniref:Uncharacterized protein n=1 Tax=Holothuria leucospilota TaxID=206669 RepID=A0A9Q1C8S3_HOLLE|nr:hypothetical protein HOLleu_14742 [Holothuria leucospilota]
MYITYKIYDLKQALQANTLYPFNRDIGFRAYKGVLVDSNCEDWKDPQFLMHVMALRAQCISHMTLIDHENLSWPMSSAIPALANVLDKINDCLQTAAEELE